MHNSIQVLNVPTYSRDCRLSHVSIIALSNKDHEMLVW